MKPFLSQRPAARAGIVMIAATLLLTGCSSTSGDGDDQAVASLPSDSASTTPGGAGASSSSLAEDERPQIRADTSADEFGRLLGVYSDCLKAHGVASQIPGGEAYKPVAQNAENTPAYDACLSQNPETYIENLSHTDPGAYQDKVRSYLNCLKSQGLDATMDPNDPTRTIIADNPMPGEQQMQVTNDCWAVDFNG